MPKKRTSTEELEVELDVPHPLISRVEIIGEGREFVKHDINGISLSFQDGGKTLKVFLGE